MWTESQGSESGRAEARQTAAEPPGAASHQGYQTQIAVLLAAAAVTGALIGARTERLAGAAGGEWETAVRAQVKRGAAATSAEILIYGNTVPNVVEFQQALIRAKEYLRELRRDEGAPHGELEVLQLLAQVESQRAESMSDLVAQEEHFFVGDSFDLDARLAAQRRESVRGLDDPARVRADGDDLSTRAVAEALTGLPAALAFLLGSVAQALGRRRRIALCAGAAALAVSIVAAVALEVVTLG